MKILFLISFILLTYTYAAYPMILFFVSKIKMKRVDKKKIYPFASIVISAYNEEVIIAEKIKNTLKLDYPREKMEIIVASDASTDKTDEIVKSFEKEGVRLLRIAGRKGKACIQNEAVLKAKGEIIIFSDANVMYDKRAIKEMAYNFNDSKIGCVTGNVSFLGSESSYPELAMKGYWEYEKFIKKYESKIGSTLGADGGMYAVRKDVYTPLASYIESDFLEPIRISQGGHRTIFEEKATAYEIPYPNQGAEFNARVRVSLRTLKIIAILLKEGFWHCNFFFLLQFFSHKLLRYWTPFILILLFILNLFLINSGNFYLFIFLAQLVFYLLAVLKAAFLYSKKFSGALSLPYHFCLTNLAILKAYYDLLTGKKFDKWIPERKPG